MSDLIDKAEALAEIKKLWTVDSVMRGDLTLKKIEAALNALPARGLHDPKDFLQETAHLYDCEISPSRECTCGLSDLRAIAAFAPTDAAQARSDLASAAPERIAIRYDGYEESIQWDAGWHLPEGREDEVTYRREDTAAQAREAALKEAAAVADEHTFGGAAVRDAILALIGEART